MQIFEAKDDWGDELEVFDRNGGGAEFLASGKDDGVSIWLSRDHLIALRDALTAHLGSVPVVASGSPWVVTCGADGSVRVEQRS